MAERTNVHIAGWGRISGGVYDTVTVAGSGRIEGDVDANLIKAEGSCRIDGDVKAKELKIAGSCRVCGEMRAERMKIAGSCTIAGDVHADEVNIAGTQTIEGSLKAKEIASAGSLTVAHDVEAEKFSSCGGFEIGGLLSAEEVKIELGGGKVTEIGGARIEVRRRRRAFLYAYGWVERRGLGYLEADAIEGDEIFLEHTKARVVRGKKIQIGEGCEIETVEYSESIEIAPGAQVKEHVKV
jgi:cytoskeletal protein CcmA (bactofilin family)